MLARTISTAALLLAAFTVRGQAPAPAQAMFRGDATHSGVYAGPAPKSIGHVLWQFKSGARIVSSPTVANGVVYIGSDDHNLYAVDARKGTPLWKFTTEASVRSSPAISGNSVYVLSLDGNLYAVEAATGKLQWKFTTAGESRNNAPGLYGLAPSLEPIADVWDFFLSSPAVDGDTVYFGSGDHNVYAIDARTGQLRWKFLAGDVVHSSPAIADGTLYIGAWDGVLYALDTRNGAVRWKFASGTDPSHFMQGIPGSPAVAAGIVVFGSRDNFLYALDAKSGQQVWRQSNHNSWIIASPALQNGIVYITTSDTMRFRALDLKTGAPLFDLPYFAYSFSSPAVASGHAYFGSFDGMLSDVDLAGRHLAGHFQVQAARDHPELLLADGHINDNAVYGPMLPDGKPNNTADANVVSIDRLLKLGSILSSPSVTGGVVYFGSADGSVYALD